MERKNKIIKSVRLNLVFNNKFNLPNNVTLDFSNFTHYPINTQVSIIFLLFRGDHPLIKTALSFFLSFALLKYHIVHHQIIFCTHPAKNFLFPKTTLVKYSTISIALASIQLNKMEETHNTMLSDLPSFLLSNHK